MYLCIDKKATGNQSSNGTQIQAMSGYGGNIYIYMIYHIIIYDYNYNYIYYNYTIISYVIYDYMI